MIAFIIGLSVLFSFQNFFASFDNFLQDTILQTGSTVDPQIIILGIDDQSLKKLGRWQDWKRTYFADIINNLSKAKPAVIGIDVSFSDLSGNPEDDKALVQAVKNSGKVVLPVKGVFNQTGTVANELDQPFDELRNVAITGHINTIQDPDKVVRRSLLFLTFNNKKEYSFSYEISKTYLNSNKTQLVSNIPLDESDSFLIDFVGKPGAYDYYPFYKVLNGEIPTDYFEGKIILIGPYSQGMLDEYMTPIDYKQAMNGIEIHANIIQNILNANFKRNAPVTINILIVIILGILSYLFFVKLKPLFSTILMFLFLILYLIFSIVAFQIFNIVVYLYYPIVTIIVIFFTTIASKYIVELLERKRITGIFGKYVAPEVVKHIIEGGDESLRLGGTEKDITVMFVDIRGFTPLSEKVKPEKLISILNEYFNLTVKSIFKFGGTLDKFIGDATMAIFNAPLSLDDHAFKTIMAALDMKTGSAELQARIFREYGITLEFGIGINTGNAIIGNIGTTFRMDYTAIGDTVNTAARLESNAKPGEILISAKTYEFVKDRINAVFYDEIILKGKDQPFAVYKVEGLLE